MKDKLPKHRLLIFTGPIDAYYESIGLPKLEYRSIYFEVNTYLHKRGFWIPSACFFKKGPCLASFSCFRIFKQSFLQQINVEKCLSSILNRDLNYDLLDINLLPLPLDLGSQCCFQSVNKASSYTWLIFSLWSVFEYIEPWRNLESSHK